MTQNVVELIVRGRNEASKTFRQIEKDADSATKGISGSLKSAGKTMNIVGRDMRNSGKRMSASMTLPILALGGAIVKTKVDFESAMSEVQGVTQATGEDFEAMEAQARDLGATTRFSATEAAEGMAFLGRAGFATGEIMESIPGLLDLAAGGAMDLGRASDIASNVMSGFNLEAGEMGRITDVMAATSMSANTNIEQLGQALSFAAPVAAGFGISLEETNAAIGVLGNAGIQGSRAGTALAGALSILSVESPELTKKLGNLGLSMADLNPETNSLSDILGKLEKAGAGTSDVMSIFGRRAGPAMVALLAQGGSALEDYTGELGESEGAASELADTMNDNTKGALLTLKSAAQELALAVAESGIIEWFTGAVEWLTKFARQLSETNPRILKIATVIALAVAAAGPLLTMLGFMVSGLGTVFTVAGTVIGAFSTIAGVAATVVAALNPVSLTIIAVGAALVALWTKSETFRDIVIGSWNAVRDGVVAAVRGIVEFIRPIFDEIVELVRVRLIEPVMVVWNKWGDDMLRGLQFFVESFMSVLGPKLDAIGTVFEMTWNTISGTVETAWNVIKTAVRGALDVVQGIIITGLKVLQGDWSGAWDSMQGVIEDTRKTIVGIANDLWDGIKKIFTKNIREVKKKVEDFGESITNPFKKAYEKVVGNSYVPDMVNEVGREFDRMHNDTVPTVESIERQVSGHFDGMGKKAEKAAQSIHGTISSLDDQYMKLKLGEKAYMAYQLRAQGATDALVDEALKRYDAIESLREERQARDESKRAAERQSEATARVIERLQTEKRELTMTAKELHRYQLEQAGATEEDIRRAEALREEIKEVKASQKAQEEHANEVEGATSRIKETFGGLIEDRLPGWLGDWRDKLGIMDDVVAVFSDSATGDGGLGGIIKKIPGVGDALDTLLGKKDGWLGQWGGMWGAFLEIVAEAVGGLGSLVGKAVGWLGELFGFDGGGGGLVGEAVDFLFDMDSGGGGVPGLSSLGLTGLVPSTLDGLTGSSPAWAPGGVSGVNVLPGGAGAFPAHAAGAALPFAGALGISYGGEALREALGFGETAEESRLRLNLGAEDAEARRARRWVANWEAENGRDYVHPSMRDSSMPSTQIARNRPQSNTGRFGQTRQTITVELDGREIGRAQSVGDGFAENLRVNSGIM